MLELLKFWQDEKGLLLARRVVVVGHRCEVVVGAIVDVLTPTLLRLVQRVQVLVVAHLGPLQSIHYSVVYRNLGIRQALDRNDLHMLVVL